MVLGRNLLQLRVQGLGFKVQVFVVSQNEGTPILSPIYYSPYYGEAQ